MLIEQPYLPNLDEQVYSVLEIAALARKLNDEGISDEQVLEGTGIKESVLKDPAARVSIRQRITVYENILNLSDDQALALRVGQSMAVSSLGIWGYAILSCNTLRGGIEFAFNYMRLAGPVGKKTFLEEGDQAVLRWENILQLDDRVVPFALELWFSSALQWIRDIMHSPFELVEMRFTYEELPYAEEYRKTFGCPVRFNCEYNEMRFDVAFMDQPTARGNPLTEQVFRELCDQLMLDLHAKTGIVKDVHSILTTQGNFPDIVTVADQLHMTTRTLRRKLATQGTSYLLLITEMRKQQSIKFLRETNMSIEEISDRVGFSDSSNFRTAFKRWTTKTPSMYRTSV
ncbi:MAG: AraC family transcriptional regulator [Sedimenticola sp.]